MSAIAKSVSVQNSNGHLSCSICQRKLTEMTLSSCFHTFCSNCLEGNIERSSRGHYECPICGTPIRPPTARSQSIYGNDDKTRDVYDEPEYTTRMGEATCDICGKDKPAISHCLQCKERFCDTCTQAHLKMKASRYHSDMVVPLHTDKEIPSGKFCPRHQSQEILFACEKCDVLLCNICKLMEHENHVTKLVSEQAKEVRQKLSSLLRHQTSYVDHLHGRLRMMDSKAYQYPYELEQEIEKVRKHASKLHIDIDKEQTTAEKELEQHYNSYIDKANDSTERLRQTYEERSSLVFEAQQLLNSGNSPDFVYNGTYLCQRLQHTDPTPDELGPDQEYPYKKFVPGITNDPQSPRLIGMVTGNKTTHQLPFHSPKTKTGKDVPLKDAPPYRRMSTYSVTSTPASEYKQKPMFPSEPVQLQTITSYHIPHDDITGYIYGIAPIPDHPLAWVTMLDHKNVILIDQHGDIVSSVDLGEPCEGVTADAKGGCFITCPRSRSIYHVTSNGEISPVARNLMLDPHGIACWQSYDSKKKDLIEELYICFTNRKGTDWYDTSAGSVNVYSFLGQDLGKAFSISSPIRIDVDEGSGMVCVSDHSNGCVTISDKEGMYTTGLYTGENEDEPFQPLGVCFDRTGHVIIADWAGGKVSRISQDGVFIQHLLDVNGPQSVAMGDDGMLWVGSKNGLVSVYKVN